MRLTAFKSKIHRATVTEADLNYEGSITIDADLMDAADVLPHEQVQILNVNNGERVHHALRAITETFAAFTRETMARGASGILFATTDYGNDSRIDKALMEEFGRPYDLRVLEEAKRGMMNIVHVCGPRAFVKEHLDYPVAIVSWADHDPGNPSIAELRKATTKTLLTGIDHERTMVSGTPEAVQAQARAAIEESQGTRFILGPGCAVPSAAPERHYAAAREAVLACA